MKVSTIRIRNFRSIEDATVLLSDFTAIVGPNNSGKTNILRAIRMALQGPEFADPDDFSTFAQRRRNITFDVQIDLSPSDRGVITRRLRRASQGIGSRITLQIVYDRSSAERRESITSLSLGRQGERFVLDRVRDGTHTALVPAVRTAAEDFALSPNSLLRQALALTVRERTAGRRNPLQKAIAALEKELAAELAGLAATLKSEAGSFLRVDSLRFDPELNGIVDSLVSMRTVVGDPLETDLAGKGGGVQSALVLALHQVVSQGIPIALVEEPESYLHPSAQRAILSRFRQRSGQIVVTTHSPIVVDALPRNRPEAVVRVGRDDAGRTVVAPQKWSERTREVLERNVGLRLSEVFFADGTLLVEGPSDREVFENLAERRHNWALKGYVVIETGGKDSLASGLQICRQLGIPAAVVADKDAFRSETPLLRKLKSQGRLDSAKASQLTSLARRPMTTEDPCDVTEALNLELHPLGCHSMPIDLEYAIPTPENAPTLAEIFVDAGVAHSNEEREWERASRDDLAAMLRSFLGAKDRNLQRGSEKNGFRPGLAIRMAPDDAASPCLVEAVDWANHYLDSHAG